MTAETPVRTPGPMTLRRERRELAAARKKARGDNLREWLRARGAAARKTRAETFADRASMRPDRRPAWVQDAPRLTPVADESATFTSSRVIRRADTSHWPARGGSLASRPKLPASIRVAVAIRNVDTGRLDRHTFAEIAAVLAEGAK